MRTIWAALFLVLSISFMSHSSSGTPAPATPPPPPQEDKLPPPPPAEKLAQIQAPPIKLEYTTQQGYKVVVDLAQQVLNLHAPKDQVWMSPEVEAHQTVEVTSDSTISRGSVELAKVKKGTTLYVSAIEKDWADVQIVKDGQVVRGWIAKRTLKPVSEARPPQVRLPVEGEFASAALLIQKAKQFDDGLYAAVEFAMQNGLGPVQGKRDWVPRLAGKVDVASGGKPLAILFAATQLAGNKTQLPLAMARLRDAEFAEFQADPKRSKPIGFYTWTPDLETIFRQDRLLQTDYQAQSHSSGVIAIARALIADPEARRSYETTLRLNARLTNKLAYDSFEKVLADLDSGRTPQFVPRREICFLPPSRSHESDLIMKLYGTNPIPAGFDLMNEVIRRLKSGELSLAPQEDSGWYDHQLYALETLIRFDSAPEARRLQPNAEYRQHLEELFKGTYALTRETHVKQLLIPRPAMAAPPGAPEKEREKIFIRPAAHVEYLPTMYLRRAASYRFVREALVETFGAENLPLMKRQTATGPVEMNLAEELDWMEQVFRGAYVVACRDIGLPEAMPGAAADEQAIVFLRWVASIRSDRDLATDSRMMVPVFFDQQRKKLKVWVMLGWDTAGTSISYARQPAVTITDSAGRPITGSYGPEVIFESTYRRLATPVFAEVYVSKLLNRTEFRQHCDTYRSKAAILSNLE